jgi:transposase
MANRLTMAERYAILALWERGWSCRRIARQLGVHRETVSRYVRAAQAAAKPANPTPGSEVGQAAESAHTTAGVGPPAGPRPANPTPGTAGPADGPIAGGPPDFGVPSLAEPAISAPGNAGRKSDCEPYRQVILEALERGLSGTRIFQDLVLEQDFASSYSSVKRFVRRLRQSTPLPFRRMECAPGDEAQIDFGRGAPVEEPGRRRRRPHLFRIVLSYSRKAYSEAVWRETTETFIRCLENAFRAWGGVPRTLVPDNLRAAVTKADWYDPDLNPKIEAFARHYGTVILPTKSRTPRHKGKIERGVGYAQDNALKGRVFTSLAEENRYLAWWETTVADTRIHGTTRHQVRTRFIDEERPALVPLPPMPFPCFQEAQRIVHRDAHVEVDKAYYSVPPEYVARRVWVRWDARLVRVFNLSLEQIAVHVKHEKGRFSTQPGHLAAEKISGVERGAEWLLGRAALIGPHVGPWAKAVLDERGIRGLRVLQGLLTLTSRHRSRAIDDACRSALASGALRLRDLRQHLQQPQTQQRLDFIEEHPLIRPVSDYADLVQVSFRPAESPSQVEPHRPAAFIAWEAAGGGANEKGPARDRALPAVQPPVAALGAHADGANNPDRAPRRGPPQKGRTGPCIPFGPLPRQLLSASPGSR